MSFLCVGTFDSLGKVRNMLGKKVCDSVLYKVSPMEFNWDHFATSFSMRPTVNYFIPFISVCIIRLRKGAYSGKIGKELLLQKNPRKDWNRSQ